MQISIEQIKQSLVVVPILLATLLLAGCPAAPEPASAQPAAVENPAAEERAIPVVTAEITVDAVNFPAEIPSGIVALAFESKGGPEGVPMLARLNDGVTLEQLMAAMQEDFMAGLALVSFIGWSEPGVEVVYDLAPGSYVAILEQEAGPPLIGTFTTSGTSTASAPEADFTAQLVNFAFVIPDKVPAGKHVWQVKNEGSQWHEMLLVKLEEGQSMDELVETVMQKVRPDGPPDIEMAALWAPMAAGKTAWITWDLAAGEYAVICVLPDITGDMNPHLAHGMVRKLTVTE